jgi:hypothetical protein
MGQVFTLESLVGSILIYIAVAIYSPLLCLMFVIGALMGTLGGNASRGIRMHLILIIVSIKYALRFSTCC